MTLRQVTKDNFSSLLMCVDPSPDLMGRLYSIQFIEDKMPSIYQQVTKELKVSALLNVLLEVPEDLQESVMSAFVSALRSSGQEHVANIFRRECDKIPMSIEHYRTLKVKKDQLCQFIGAENGLLDKLGSTDVISCSDESDIRSVSGYNEKARKLIEVLMRKSDDAFEGFVNALNQSGQSHVAYILTGEGNSRPLGEKCRDKLIEKRPQMVENITPECLMSKLISKRVFSHDDQQRVEAQITNDGKSEVMIDLIARKSQAAYDDFIKTLRECHHTHVANALIGSEVIGRIKAQISGANEDVAMDVEGEVREVVQQGFENDENDDTGVKQLKKHLNSNGISFKEISEGSVIVKFHCKDHDAILALQRLYCSKELDQLFSKTFRPKLAGRGVESLSLSIAAEEFQQHIELKLMTDEHRKALLSSEEWILDKMTVSGELLDKLSLCGRRREAIERAATHKQQVKALLDFVSRQPDSAFDQLLSALKNTDQHEAADIISRDSRSEASELHIA